MSPAKVKELLADFERRERSCKQLIDETPQTAEEFNVRRHVRLRAKKETYAHCADLLKGYMNNECC